MENRDHLFFGCCFAKDIWRSILQLCGLDRVVGSWNEELQWAITKFKGKALPFIVLRIAWRAYVYFVWRERNKRIYEQKSESSYQIVERIKEAVYYRLYGLKNIEIDSVNSLICTNWNLVIF
ncbi:hypothetical protein DITRI_Ditri19aG0128100 [Diplodiscus trichospermus]